MVSFIISPPLVSGENDSPITPGVGIWNLTECICHWVFLVCSHRSLVWPRVFGSFVSFCWRHRRIFLCDKCRLSIVWSLVCRNEALVRVIYWSSIPCSVFLDLVSSRLGSGGVPLFLFLLVHLGLDVSLELCVWLITPPEFCRCSITIFCVGVETFITVVTVWAKSITLFGVTGLLMCLFLTRAQSYSAHASHRSVHQCASCNTELEGTWTVPQHDLLGVFDTPLSTTSLFGVIRVEVFLLDPVIVLVSWSLVGVVGLDWYIFLGVGCVKFALVGISVKTGSGVQVLTWEFLVMFVCFPLLSSVWYSFDTLQT